jgi:hypothetical protein
MAVKAFGECTDGGIIFLKCFFRRNIDIVVNMGLFFQVLSMFGQLTLDTPKMRSCCCVSCLAKTALNFYVVFYASVCFSTTSTARQVGFLMRLSYYVFLVAVFVCQRHQPFILHCLCVD